jgi:hypothetical protein
MDQAIRSFCHFGMSDTEFWSSDFYLLALFLSSKEGVGHLPPARLLSWYDDTRIFLVAFRIRELTFSSVPYRFSSDANIFSPADVGDTAALMLSRGFWGLWY